MFKNRTDAAEQLIPLLDDFKKNPEVIVLAIPRGAVPMGAQIAHALHAPLDILLTKKISAPFNSEFAIGAATPDSFFIDPSYERADLVDFIQQETANVQKLLKERARTYRRWKQPLSVKNKIAIVIDDGVATGRTMLAAVHALQQQKPKEIIIAVPVISPEAKILLEQHGARVISVITPPSLGAIGQFYEEFPQVSDDEAQNILQDYKKDA